MPEFSSGTRYQAKRPILKPWKLTKADNDMAEQYLKRALAKDPASALAYSGMAMVWINRRLLGFAPVREAGQKAKAAALKAVELDETAAEAHVSLATVYAWTDFNFREAEREYKRALELDPNNSLAWVLCGHVLMILGRPEEALRHAEHGVAMDPLDAGIRALDAAVLIFARRYDDALTQANEALRMQSNNPVAWSEVFIARHFKRHYADAIAAATTHYESSGWPQVAAALKKGYAETGYAGALRRATEVELARYGNEGAVAFDAASNYAMAGDLSRTLDVLERAYAEGEPNIPYISCMPIFDPLRAEPRFQALLRRMNLPQ